MTFTDGETAVESNITGIIPSYRGKGYYKDLIRFNQNHHWESSMDFCTCGARIQNIPAQRAFANEDMYVKNYVFGIHLFPFLQKTIAPPITFRPQLEEQYKDDQTQIVQQLHQIIVEKWTNFTHRDQTKWIWNSAIHLTKPKIVTLSFPILTDTQLLAVAQLKADTEKVIGVVYLKYVC